MKFVITDSSGFDGVEFEASSQEEFIENCQNARIEYKKMNNAMSTDLSGPEIKVGVRNDYGIDWISPEFRAFRGYDEYISSHKTTHIDEYMDKLVELYNIAREGWKDGRKFMQKLGQLTSFASESVKNE